MVRSGLHRWPRSRWHATLTHLILLVGFTTSPGNGWFGNDCTGRVVAADEVDWKVGIEFRKALDSPLGLNWGDNPAREALRNLSHNKRVAIWLDRRIDPGKKMQFESQDLPLDITLDKLCLKYELGRSVVGPVILYWSAKNCRQASYAGSGEAAASTSAWNARADQMGTSGRTSHL